MKKTMFVLLFVIFIIGCSAFTEQRTEKSVSGKADEKPSQDSTLYKTTESDWTLGQSWSVVNKTPFMLKGVGHTWATLNQNLDGNSLMRFTLQRQKGNININIKNNPTGRGLFRYILSIADGTELVFQKQQGDSENIQDLTQVSLPSGKDWSGATAHVVEIKTVNQQIIVRVDGQRVIFFTDAQPLTRGTLAFETVEESAFVVSGIEVSAGNENLQEEAASLPEAFPVAPSEEVEAGEDYGFNLPPEQDALGWKQTSGPLGGTVIRMVPHGITIWASLYSGGIYDLEPDDSWEQIGVGHGLPEVRAFDIIFDPSNSNLAYIPETITCGAKTMDNGKGWQGLCENMLKYIDSPNFFSNTLALDPADPNIIYMPGHMHNQTSIFLVSKDGGEHWETLFTFDQQYDFNQLVFFHSKMYLATIDQGILVSSDHGKSWTPLNTGLEEQTATRFVEFKNKLYLLTALRQFNVRMGGSLYRLADNGASWEKIPELNQVTGLGTDGTTLFAGTWNPEHPTPRFLVSMDGSSFEEKPSQGLPTDWIGEIVHLNSKIYVGVGGNGVYVSSDDGNTFAEFNKGLVSVATREVHVNPQDENEIYVGTWDRLGFYWSKNGGEGYRHLATEYYVLTLQPDPQDFSRVYLGGDRFAVGTIARDGSRFTERKKPGSPTTFVKAIAIDPKNSNHILAGVAEAVKETPPGEGLWESQDGGESWTRAQGIGNFAVYAILFDPMNPQIVYVSALGAGVFKSTDGSSHFQKIGDERLKYTYRMAMSPSDPQVLVASSNLFFGQLSTADQYSGKYGGIFQSKDGGTTWKELTAGIRNYAGGDNPEDFVEWLYNFGHLPNYEQILIDPKNPDHLVVGHHGENVIETIDGGATWKKAGAEEIVPNRIHNYAYCLGTSPSFKKFYACSCGRGLFRGVMNEKGYISSSLTGDVVYNNEPDEHPHLHTAQEAREFILSGEYNHQH